jgi:hypothetical protein
MDQLEGLNLRDSLWDDIERLYDKGNSEVDYE